MLALPHLRPVCAVSPHTHPTCRPQSGTSRSAATAASPAGPPDLSTLWFTLQVPHLSQVVELGPAYIQPTAPQHDRQLSLCLAVALPLLQRHLLNTLPQAEYRVRAGPGVWMLCSKAWLQVMRYGCTSSVPHNVRPCSESSGCTLGLHWPGCSCSCSDRIMTLP